MDCFIKFYVCKSSIGGLAYGTVRNERTGPSIEPWMGPYWVWTIVGSFWAKQQRNKHKKATKGMFKFSAKSYSRNSRYGDIKILTN